MKAKLVLLALIFGYLVTCTLIFFPDNYSDNSDDSTISDTFNTPGILPFHTGYVYEPNQPQSDKTSKPIRILILSQIMFGLSVAIFVAGRKFDFGKNNKKLFYAICVSALLARAVMFVGADDKFQLSDDVYRYIWDGKVAANGINPFLYSPTAEELTDLRDDTIYPYINHPHLPTIYPPLAQNIFLMTYLLGGDSPIPFKVVSILFEILTFFALAIWLRIEGINKNRLLLYLFSPLILIEFYMSAHLDILAMPFLIAALIAIRQKRPAITGILIALASLVKFFGLFFVPILFFHFKKREKLQFASSFALTMVLMYLPYIIGSEGRFLGSLFKYLGTWRYYSSVATIFSTITSFETARWICGSLLVLWLGYVALSKFEIHNKLLKAIGGYIVLTTTLFPWYLVWALPFALRSLSVPFLLLTGTIFLSYHLHFGMYLSGTWFEQSWLRLITYVPFGSLLIWFALRQRESKNS